MPRRPPPHYHPVMRAQRTGGSVRCVLGHSVSVVMLDGRTDVGTGLWSGLSLDMRYRGRPSVNVRNEYSKSVRHVAQRAATALHGRWRPREHGAATGNEAGFSRTAARSSRPPRPSRSKTDRHWGTGDWRLPGPCSRRASFAVLVTRRRSRSGSFERRRAWPRDLARCCSGHVGRFVGQPQVAGRPAGGPQRLGTQGRTVQFLRRRGG